MGEPDVVVTGDYVAPHCELGSEREARSTDKDKTY